MLDDVRLSQLFRHFGHLDAVSETQGGVADHVFVVVLKQQYDGGQRFAARYDIVASGRTLLSADRGHFHRGFHLDTEEQAFNQHGERGGVGRDY